jgi:dTDP-4-amino-4,6-dideoxygalactose transaminase
LQNLPFNQDNLLKSRIFFIQKKRRDIVTYYKKLLHDDERIRFLKEEEFSNACFHLCSVLIDFENLNINKKLFFEKLKLAGLNLQIHYIPVYWQPYYQKLGLCPNAEKYYRQAVSLPLYYDLATDDINEIVDRLLKAF